jgi:hypothetical protein
VVSSSATLRLAHSSPGEAERPDLHMVRLIAGALRQRGKSYPANNLWRALSDIATTAGCFSLRSSEIA